MQIPRQFELPLAAIRSQSLDKLQSDAENKKLLIPPTQYYRWFLYAARVIIGRSTCDVPEYLKRWQSLILAEGRPGTGDEDAMEGEDNEHNKRQSIATVNAYATLGLGDPTDVQDSLF